MGLEINYRDTIRKAEQLQTLARDITGVCGSTIENIQSATCSAWVGDGGDKFRKKLNKSNVALSNKAKSLNKLASDLGKTARRFEMIEKAALSVFKK